MYIYEGINTITCFAADVVKIDTKFPLTASLFLHASSFFVYFNDIFLQSEVWKRYGIARLI